MFIKIDPIIKSRFEFEVPSLREITEKTAITLVNTDCAIEAPEPLPPNIIPVGGLQITDPKPLSEKMEKFVKAGKKGTILMSLGTNLKSSLLGADKLKIIMETFKTFSEYNFLWKFEADEKDLPMKKPSNLMIEKFLPQNDILAHSSVKAFITHSGMLSTHEAFYNGVPIIGIPFIADQHSNAQKAINIGVGIKIDFTKLSVETFKSAINEVLTNPKYAKNADKISRLFRDKPSRPLQSAIWWIEFAMRNPNLENMKSPSLKLGFFAANSYDVIIFVVVIFILIKRLITKIFIKIFNLKDNSKQKRE
jgi:glucuronosyltransferase